MNKTLYINDTALSDYGIYCSSDTYLNAPSIDYSEYMIPARTGNIIQDNKRLNNVIRVFSCFCKKETVNDSIDDLKKLIYSNRGNLKIASDYEPNIYQYGYFHEEMVIRPIIHEDVAIFELNFNCNPKKYENEDYSMRYSSNASNIENILFQDDSFLNEMLNFMPANLRPSNSMFYVVTYNPPTARLDDRNIRLLFDKKRFALCYLDVKQNGEHSIEYMRYSYDSKIEITDIPIAFITDIPNGIFTTAHFIIGVEDWEEVSIESQIATEQYGILSWQKLKNFTASDYGNYINPINQNSLAIQPVIDYEFEYEPLYDENKNEGMTIVPNRCRLSFDFEQMESDGFIEFLQMTSMTPENNPKYLQIYFDFNTLEAWTTNIANDEKISLNNYVIAEGDFVIYNGDKIHLMNDQSTPRFRMTRYVNLVGNWWKL